MLRFRAKHFAEDFVIPFHSEQSFKTGKSANSIFKNVHRQEGGNSRGSASPSLKRGAFHPCTPFVVKEEEAAQRISAKTVLDKLLPMLHRTAWNQEVRYTVEEAQLSSKQCISLALVLNELVTNALKHGRNTADVVFRLENEQAVLEVLDDGPGFQEGFNPLEASNMGLELVESLIQTDLRGRSHYDTRSQGGGRVVVSFPLPPREP